MTKISTRRERQSPPSQNVVILGSGGLAREIAWLIAEINAAGDGNWNIIGFWNNKHKETGQVISGYPVLSEDDIARHLPELFAVAAIGNPDYRQRAVEEARSLGCLFTKLIHPDVRYDHSTVEIGVGSIVCAGNILNYPRL